VVEVSAVSFIFGVSFDSGVKEKNVKHEQAACFFVTLRRLTADLFRDKIQKIYYSSSYHMVAALFAECNLNDFAIRTAA
jgi:hypothetical protein